MRHRRLANHGGNEGLRICGDEAWARASARDGMKGVPVETAFGGGGCFELQKFATKNPDRRSVNEVIS